MQVIRLFILGILIVSGSYAQDKYYVFFTDKDGVEFNPHSYFSEKAIERRNRLGYPLDHPTDKPLVRAYVNQVSALCDSTRYELRWLNALTCHARPEQVANIQKLPFVKGVEPIVDDLMVCGTEDEMTQGKRKLIDAQINRMNGRAFHEAGYTGKGIRIAILDAGFPGVDWLPQFKHIRSEGRIRAHYDFVKKKKGDYKGHKHGTMVLSNIAGKSDTVLLGMAPDAQFLLARTEAILKEGLTDEESWLAAVEWADKLGADIINSSLGYTKRMYFRKNMDGKTAFITRAANLAASKGILVVNSAGNEGTDKYWRTIGAPADADSVLAVGGINPWTNMHTSWSSFGPSADKRIKPNVSAYGHAIVANAKGLVEVTGTSFASPLTAGWAACAWQSDTSMSNMDLFQKIEQSGDLYPYYDYAHGYGVPQGDIFLNGREEQEATFTLEKVDEVTLKVHIKPEYFEIATRNMRSYYQDNEKDTAHLHIHNGQNVKYGGKGFKHVADVGYNHRTTNALSGSSKYFHYHIENSEGHLDVYYVIGVEEPNVLTLRIDDEDKGKTFRFWYKGYVEDYKIE